MRIAVVSDTHDNLKAIGEIVEILKKRDIKTVFHLGDFIAPFSLKKFSGFELYGVFGNNDGERLMLKKVATEEGFAIEDYPLEVEIDAQRFLLLHGNGSIEKTRKMAYSFAKSGDYDFVLYGHTHRIDISEIRNTKVLNPGEACGYLTGKRTFAVIEDGKINIVNI